MRRLVLGAVLGAWTLACAADAARSRAALTGDADAIALVDKVIAALGGEDGLKKRLQLYVEQEVQVLNLTVNTCLWIKGDKQRIEQRMGNVPGAPVVVIFDGAKLFLLVNEQKRDPGDTLTKAYHAERKRVDIWWDCHTKPLAVKSLGSKKLKPHEKAAERELTLLEFTHPDKDTTTVGIDLTTNQPVYIAYRGPHPQTGKMIPWTQWLGDFTPMESAGGLIFPRVMEIYQDTQKISTAKLKVVKTPAEIPDTLFGIGTTRPVD